LNHSKSKQKKTQKKSATQNNVFFWKSIKFFFPGCFFSNNLFLKERAAEILKIFKDLLFSHQAFIFWMIEHQSILKN